MVDDRKPKIILKDAETLLQQAKTHLDKGEPIKAIQTAKKADRTINRTAADFERAVLALENARKVVEEARRNGIDTGLADDLLSKAGTALINGRYSEVIPQTRKAFTALQSASFIPGRDLTVNTKITYDHGKIRMSVDIENKTDFQIRTLRVKPDFTNTNFLQENERTLSLKPGRTETVEYNLTPTTLPGIGKKNSPAIGRDITVETTLRKLTKENKIIYAVSVTNNTAEAITNIAVRPNLSQEYIPDMPVKSIDHLMPGEKKQVVFELELRRAS